MAEDSVQGRLAAILGADVVGYSHMMSVDEVGTLSRLKSLRRESFDPQTKQNGGRIFKTTGDGAFVEFKSAVGAVKSAVDIQKAVAARNTGGHRKSENFTPHRHQPRRCHRRGQRSLWQRRKRSFSYGGSRGTRRYLRVGQCP